MSPAVIHHNSSDSTPISCASLSPSQAQVASALAQGHTITAAAHAAGVHRTTVHHWLRHEPAFQAEVVNARSQYFATLGDEMRELTALALKTIRTLLDDPDTPPAIRLKAALAALTRPQVGWGLPELVDSPLDREVVDVSEEIESAAVSRNAPCPCGSGRKYKRCCADRVTAQAAAS